MKKKVFLFVVSVIFIMLISAMLLHVGAEEPTEATEEEQLDVTDSYYYDRLSENQQRCYAYIKDYYDNYWQGEIDVKQIDILYWVGEDATDEECKQLNYDFMYAQLALEADYPLYDYYGDFGVSYHRHTEGDMAGKLEVILHIKSYNFVTEEMIIRADARIEQIATAVGEGDRYTRLRRMTAYLLDNTFYDPYLDAINYIGRPSCQKSGVDFDACAYGVLLKNIAMCEGFTDAVKVLCDELGIPCIIMGNAAHAWNLVQMEDGKWYRLDITNACRLGWDGDLSQTLDEYFEQIFLNNNTVQADLGAYDFPYMLSLNNVPLVTDFPEHAEGQYVYSGDETDFSYEDVQSTYMPEWSKFIYHVNFDGITCTIFDYEGKESGDLIIPESIDGYTVIAIDEYAFYYCTGFTGRLVIPDTVQSIGRGAFAGCYNLTSVEFPEGLYDIGVGAFIGCKGLKEIALPDRLGRIEKYAFCDCDSLELVTFGRHVFEIDATAFGGIDAPLMMKAPDGSAAYEYAQQKNLAFEVYGEMCAFEDADGKWDFDEMKGEYWRLVEEVVHFHVCEHGARFDYEEHSLDIESANCGDVCADCGANFCRGFGYTHTAPQRINKTEATCSDPAYTGDLVCAFGCLIQNGEYVGEPTGEHIPANDVWQYDEYYHYNSCSCGWELVGTHHGGTATEEQRAICEECGAEYGELLHVHRNFIWHSNGEEGHYKACADCGENMNESEPHRGGTATEDMRAQCEVCGDYYGNFAEHIHSAAWRGSDEYSHYWVCSCGEKLDIESHYGGTATEYELAICEICGEHYGNFAEHIHNAIWQQGDENCHYWVCPCGEKFNIEAHYGGTASEGQRAICVVCGMEYGDFAEHVHSASWYESDEYIHRGVCICGEKLNIESHYGGTATENLRAICVICGIEYGNLAEHVHSPSSKGNNEHEHYQICDCGERLNVEAHYGGTATEDQRAICEECGAEYGELVHVHRNFIWLSGGEEGHYKVCADCGENMNETEPHRGGTATEDVRAQCEVCGDYYGDVLPHTTHVCSYWVYASEEIHYQVCEICYVQFNEGPHQGGVATETQRAICELCDGAYGDYAPHVSISTGSDEYGHFDVCACGETFNFEAHYGGTATDDELPICVVCGVAYGHIHTPIADGCDEYGHYQICDCGEILNFEAHYGGTATENQLALCEVCGMAYGTLAAHVHTATWLESEENSHYWICPCGEAFDFEPHYGGVATEDQLALCEVCGVGYGTFAEHVHDDLTTVAAEGFHYQICSCGVWLGEERHYGGTATETQRAICVVCGTEYGDYATDTPENNTEAPENNTEAPENNTEAPENNTEAPENNTEAPENNTEAPENNTEAPENNTEKPENNTEKPESNTPESNTEATEGSTPSGDNSSTNGLVAGSGCGSTLGMGLVGFAVALAAGFVFSKKRYNN